MNPETIVLVGQVAGAATAVGGAVYGGIKVVVPRVRAGLKVLSDIAGLPQIVAAIKSEVDHIGHEVRPNSGGTVFDKLGNIASDVRVVKAMQRARGHSSPHGEFESDADGRCVYSNGTYLRWTGRSADDLYGWGWLGCIAEQDRDNVREEWIDCVKLQREFRMRYAMVNHATGDEFTVITTAIPVRDGNVVRCWVGHVEKRIPTETHRAVRLPPDEE